MKQYIKHNYRQYNQICTFMHPNVLYQTYTIVQYTFRETGKIVLFCLFTTRLTDSKRTSESRSWRPPDNHSFQVHYGGFVADSRRLLIIMEWTPNSEALQNLAGILSISNRSSSAAVSSSYDVRVYGRWDHGCSNWSRRNATLSFCVTLCLSSHTGTRRISKPMCVSSRDSR